MKPMPDCSLCRRLALPVMLVALLALVGCQGRGNITGVVKYTGSGQPLKTGKISFLSERTKAVSSSLIKDGNYEVKNVPAGPAKVSIESLEFPKQQPGNTKPAPPTYLTDPKYADPQKSGVTYDVQSGDQSKDFDVPPAPKK